MVRFLVYLSSLDEVNLEEGLEVEVGNFLAILYTEELGELSIRDNATLEVRIKAVVCLDVVGDELGHIRLGALALGRKTHECGELIRDRAELEERVVRTTSLISLALFRSHFRRILSATLLGITSLTLECLGSLLGFMHSCANTSNELSVEGAERFLETSEDCIGRAYFSGYCRCSSGGRGSGRNSYFCLGGGFTTFCGCGISRCGGYSCSRLLCRHVCISRGLGGRHF
jgi:hypothetical protein